MTRYRRLFSALMVAGLLVGMLFTVVSASTVTPSDNDTNRENGWAHFNVLDTRIGEVDVEFVSTRGFLACFEFRSDGDTSQRTNDTNHNPAIGDGLYPFVCVNNNTASRTLAASDYVEIRMVFGAETDERFDWTRVDVLPNPTPSDNDANRDLDWAHFNVLDTRVGEVDIELVSTRGFLSCFEFRTDGDESQMASPNNYNSEIDDGLYPFRCISNSTLLLTFQASDYIEIRMVFGAERDERFDWTRVDVLPDAQAKDDCMKGGWQDFGFKNQGQCIQFVNTGKDSR